MRCITILFLMLFTLTSLFSQVPQAIKYQVVVRDNNGIPVTNKTVSLKISLLKNGINGTAAYIETHNTSTNAFGIIILSIGTGDSVLNDLDDVKWNLHKYFAKVEVDTSGGTNYLLLGTSRLLTVPYSFHSGSSDLPSMTTIERNDLQNPRPGMQIFNTTQNCINVFNGTIWYEMCGVRQWLCGDVLVDSRDNKQYPTVKIGDQCWMGKNLNTGTQIPGSTAPANNSIIEKHCYNNSGANCNTYGGLYRWDELMDYTTAQGSRGICPEEWHVPGSNEWHTLTQFLGGIAIAGYHLKETGLTHWRYVNQATNSSGFTALPGGSYDNGFIKIQDKAYFFTSTLYSPSLRVSVKHLDSYKRVYSNALSRSEAYSLRCIYNH